MSRAANAIRFLEIQTMTAHDAVEQLRNSLNALTPLSLFQHYFPREFAAQRFRWDTGAGVQEACSRFTELVDRRLFPCYGSWEFDEGWVERIADIVFPAPFPAWYEDVRDQATFGRLEELILVKFGNAERHAEELKYVYREERAQLDIETLERLCAQKREAVRYLPLAVKFFLKITDNLWCDVTQEELDSCGDWPTWSLEATEHLRKEWAAARVICGRVSQVEEWLGRKPGNQRIVENLLRQATEQPKGKRQSVRVTTQGAPLIERMDEWIESED